MGSKADIGYMYIILYHIFICIYIYVHRHPKKSCPRARFKFFYFFFQNLMTVIGLDFNRVRLTADWSRMVASARGTENYGVTNIFQWNGSDYYREETPVIGSQTVFLRQGLVT